MTEVKKIDIAVELLESALYHYYESAHFFSAIQCAGAAEEIFGCYVKKFGGEHALENLNKATRGVTHLLTGIEVSKKEILSMLNYAKNSTKHMDNTNDDLVTLDPKEEARDLLDRAIDNFYFLFQYMDLKETINILRFNSRQIDKQ